ncbi:MAG: hypothetical protein SGPRY_013936 [Prymnesium sp.]
MTRAATHVGQLPTMGFAALVHACFYALMLWYDVPPLSCTPSGCSHGTRGACWRLNGSREVDAFPLDCLARGIHCAECDPYNIDGGQSCAAGFKQCEWLHGDMVSPAASDVAFVLTGICAFHVGDAAWESQVCRVELACHL